VNRVIRILTGLGCLLLIAQPMQALERFDYRVLERMPQTRANFVQGLQIVDGDLFVSTGGYGKSQLLRYSMEGGALEAGQRLHPRLFGEGLAVVGERIFQLTWRARMVLVYDRDSLALKRWFRIPGQGWGLTWTGSELLYSDGSDRLHFMNPDSGVISRSVRVTREGRPLPQLNELEWIDGQIWANVWQTDTIVIIDPVSGRVTAELDLTGLLPESDRRPDTDVLNGIAHNPDDDGLWVTGKRWPWLYRIELVPRKTAATETP